MDTNKIVVTTRQPPEQGRPRDSNPVLDLFYETIGWGMPKDSHEKEEQYAV